MKMWIVPLFPCFSTLGRLHTTPTRISSSPSGKKRSTKSWCRPSGALSPASRSANQRREWDPPSSSSPSSSGGGREPSDETLGDFSMLRPVPGSRFPVLRWAACLFPPKLQAGEAHRPRPFRKDAPGRKVSVDASHAHPLSKYRQTTFPYWNLNPEFPTSLKTHTFLCFPDIDILGNVKESNVVIHFLVNILSFIWDGDGSETCCWVVKGGSCDTQSSLGSVTIKKICYQRKQAINRSDKKIISRLSCN